VIFLGVQCCPGPHQVQHLDFYHNGGVARQFEDTIRGQPVKSDLEFVASSFQIAMEGENMESQKKTTA
jgi:hypothetical protein